MTFDVIKGFQPFSVVKGFQPDSAAVLSVNTLESLDLRHLGALSLCRSRYYHYHFLTVADFRVDTSTELSITLVLKRTLAPNATPSPVKESDLQFS